PIAYEDDAALQQLGGIADYFLVHNRPIHMRCDDSVLRVALRTAEVPHTQTPTLPPAETMLRRSRGFAPAPLPLREPLQHSVLACGAELKNTFCLGKADRAFLSHHIGDLENYETLRSFREGIRHFCRLFDVTPS